MTQEQKELLLIDLSARLIHGVIVDYKEDEYDFHHWKISTLHAPAYSQSGSLINTDSDGWIEYEEYKGCGMSTGSRPLHLGKVLPYLRPLSSMTEEEMEKYKTISIYGWVRESKVGMTDICPTIEGYDWLNAHHFDYHELIEKGLAIEAPKDMYK